MDINSVNNGNLNPLSDSNNNQKKVAKNDAPKKNANADKIQISKEAKVMQAKTEKMAAIKEKIENKFYDREDVINKVAEGVLKDIKGNS